MLLMAQDEEQGGRRMTDEQVQAVAAPVEEEAHELVERSYNFV